jgi:cobalt-zinc-cadmium efflux system outer membrane protein
MTKDRRWYWLGIGLLVLASAGQASDMTAAEYFDEPQLAALLWQRSSEVLEARAAVAAAESERRRAFLYPNPTLDFGWNTIPVGRTNPPGLEDRWSKVPNYAVSVAELVELGKRGPRQRALT